MKNSFQEVAINPNNSKWENTISRILPLSYRNSDIRTEFDRDYTRIIHSNAYKRLKHKTQVFFSPENDHICTRGEHVTHVESISFTIATPPIPNKTKFPIQIRPCRFIGFWL